MSEKERLAEVAALLLEYDRKLEEAEVILRRMKSIVNPASTGARKKPTRRPEDIIREVLQ